MFTLSIGKILFTIFIIVAVWKGFALVSRLAREQKEALARRANAPRRAAPRPRQSARTVELVRCSRCGAYFDPGEGCGCGA